MTAAREKVRRKVLASAFKMPSVPTMVSRKSSITNAFVNSVIPAIPAKPSRTSSKPSPYSAWSRPMYDVRIAAIKATEWDHMRPLVLNHRPTGYISEIANLVPACGKCNQSKGNQPWRDWMLSSAKHRQPDEALLT